jgi:multimeric flavodoxin WrbA
MKVVAFNGSPRRGGNTARLIGHVFEPLQAQGIETELIQLGGSNIHGCRACRKCFEDKNHRCAFADDIANDCIEKMRQADGIILGTPTYVADVTPEIKALIDRACLVNRANGGMFRRKVGAAVMAVRRSGAIHAFDTMNHFFQITEMIIPGSCYWNMGFGFDKGEIENDEEGLRTMRVLGENLAWLLEKTAS